MALNLYRSAFIKKCACIRRLSSAAPFQELVYENAGGIATFGLNRPKQRNAFNINIVKELNDALDNIRQREDTRVLLIRSMVKEIFCAGADLKERKTLTQQQVSQFVSGLRALMSRIENLPIPVIAAIDGTALGGGLELALACDIRIASTCAKLGLVETKLAIIPGAGGSQRLPRLINPSVAKELIYTSRIFNGKEAKDLGIVNHAVDQNETGDAAFKRATEIAKEIIPNGPIAVRVAKIAINKGIEVDLNTGLSIEENCYAQLIPTKDRLEGLKAFAEKRPPNYTGE